MATSIAELPVSWAQSAPGDKAARALRVNVVAIEAEWEGGAQQGFGFIVAQDGDEVYVATANHVVRDKYSDAVASRPTVRFFHAEDDAVTATLLAPKDEERDLAVLRAPIPAGSIWHRQLRGAAGSVKRGELVSFVGRGDRWYVPSRPGTINRVDEQSGLILVDGLNVIVGTSGAPLVSAEGIVGMVVRGETDSIAHALSLNHIEASFDDWNLPWTLNRSRDLGKDSIVDCGDCPELVMLPLGTFMMGSAATAPEHQTDEGPQRRVSVLPFAIGKFEVTFAQWDACVQAGGCAYRPNDGGWGRANRPVIDISWDDAQGYTRWLSEITGKRYRLPTEAEWEYAARAGTSTVYWWGDAMESNRANCRNCRNDFAMSGKTLPVGSFEANDFGLFDTAGNVHEYVQDCYAESYEDAPDVSDVANQTQPCRRRGRRGGSWGNGANKARAANRSREYPNVRKDTSGLRVARDP